MLHLTATDAVKSCAYMPPRPTYTPPQNNQNNKWLPLTIQKAVMKQHVGESCTHVYLHSGKEQYGCLQAPDIS